MSLMKKYIHNWDELSEEQKDNARKQFKGNAGLNSAVVHPAAKFFEEHGWVKIDRFIDQNMANLLYHHVQLEATRLNYYEDQGIEVDKGYEGTFADHQAPGDFSKYGDPIFDALLSISLEQMENLTARELVPTYSYHRLYTTGTELERHQDRASCEISTTLCLGYDVSNVDASKYPDWNWPMGFKEKNGKEVSVQMLPGDMIIYRGDELEHWREPFWGKNHAQVFLHYNERGGKYDIPFDGRPVLGMRDIYRSKEAVAKQDLVHDKSENITENKLPTKVIY
tara:strand:- start:2291 stop:3133 length:843 start_codon:yes stop_codon:yes gene_type:complete